MNLKAVVMCGGAGSRLRPLTESKPKPLCRILNVPVLETILRSLSEQGISDIYLSLGCKAQDIIDFCESRAFNATLHYCEEKSPLGTAGGVRNCIQNADETVLVVSGDNLTDQDFTKAEAFHKASGAAFTIIGKDVPDPREYGAILKDEEGNIQAFVEKPTWEQAASFTINTGMYLLNGEILSMIPEKTFFDFSEDLFPILLAEKKKFVCYKTEAYWGDMGEFSSFHDMTRELLSGKTDIVAFRGKLIEEDAADENGNVIIAPCLIGEHAQFGKNNKIGPFCVFGDHAHIGSGCTIRDCIAGDDLTVGDGSDLDRALADDNVTVGSSCVLEKGTAIGFGCEIGKFSRVFSDVRIWPGRKIAPESIVSQDMLYETPEKIEIDTFGISGKLFSQITVSDAARLGQAIGSVKGMHRIGVGCDSKTSSEIYKNICGAGIRTCGVICYDFEEMFRAQSCFYASYCSLDAFIYVSCAGDLVQFSFLGRDGLPVPAKTARKINNNFRFSSFQFAEPDQTKDVFRMHLLSTAYTASLQRLLSCGLNGKQISVECENPLLKRLISDFLLKAGAVENSGGLQFLFNETGTEMYCIENEKFYSSDRIKMRLCELEFAQGKNVVVGEDVSDVVRKVADRYGRKVITLYENADEYRLDPIRVAEYLWNFDAVFLAVKLMDCLFSAKISLAELMENSDDFVIRKKIIELDLPPQALRERILSAGAKKTAPDDVYYTYSAKKGNVRIRQLGNSSRVRVLCEAKDMETATELSADVCAKIAGEHIDNN